uniref:Uncharacterized protein n=1 Tax=Avena sativa TaxID=4498 RepID=A0ACD5VL80_AVESA
MEPAATPFLVSREPAPPKTAQRWALWAILSLVTGGFAWGLYRARHSVPSLLFVVSDYGTTYCGLRVLYVCLRKHELLRGDDDPAAAAELRRVKRVPWVLSVFLNVWMALRVQSAVTSLAPNFCLQVLPALAIGLGFYFSVAAHRGDARAVDDGRWPEGILHDHEVSPEQTV